MGGKATREKKEENLTKIAAVGNKFRTYLKHVIYGLSIIGSALLTFLTFGTILLIDGGITMAYLIISIGFAVQDKLISKYLKYLSESKKRDFRNFLYSFYERIFDNSIINSIENLIIDFIEQENIIEKVNKKFDDNRNRFIDDSNKFKNKFNILIIGPTGAGKSTLINEILGLSNEDKAKEGKGDIQTLGFKEYTSNNSKFNFIDSQGFDMSKPISEFSKNLQTKIKECNQKPESFIDMIYYCTKDMDRFQIQEVKVINELKKLFNFNRIPLIIVFTQCYFEEDFEIIKNFIQEKYKNENFTILRVLAKQKGLILPYGLDELKEETEKKLNNFTENSYTSKYIANISQVLFKEYTDSFFSSFIKGIWKQEKDNSIQLLFNNIFNMYRFQKNDLPQNFLERIQKIKEDILQNYEKNLKDLTIKIIDLHAETYIIKRHNLDKSIELSGNFLEQKQTKKNDLMLNEEKNFKEDIDTIVFPCCLDILKIELIKAFNGNIFESLQPKIKELMPKHN